MTAICPAGPPKLSSGDAQPDPRRLAQRNSVLKRVDHAAEAIAQTFSTSGSLAAARAGQLWVSACKTRHHV